MKNGAKFTVILLLIVIAVFLAVKLQDGGQPVETNTTAGITAKTTDISITPTPQKTNHLPEGFVYITDVIPNADLDIRYYGTHNFVGERIDGYKEETAILTAEAASALKKAADDLYKQGYIITVYDAYRPVKAVAHFMRWVADTEDIKTKEEFYPAFNKDYLKDRFISSRSAHSRGSTLDLSILDFEGNAIDMGGYFDLFDSISYYKTDKINETQVNNRKILRDAMVSAGFIPSEGEWWHFRLDSEPYPDKYFDFDVE